MPFWSSQTLRSRIPSEGLIDPFEESRVVHAAYEMGVGTEAFITSNPTGDTRVLPGSKISIPPGQFGMLVTREVVHIPPSVIAFISIRAGIKFQGLVNVSGFHVDPGFHGRLRFAVYNAGSRTIVLDQNQRIFMIWFADLDEHDDNPYSAHRFAENTISSDDVSKLQGDVASPAMLKRQLDDLKVDVEKKFLATEQTRLFNRTLIMLLMGIAVSVALGLLSPYLGK